MTEQHEVITQLDLVTCQVGKAHIAFLSHHVLTAQQIKHGTDSTAPHLAGCLHLPLTPEHPHYLLQLRSANKQTQTIAISSEMLLVQLPLTQVFALPTMIKQCHQLPGLVALAYDAQQQNMLSIIDPTEWKA